MNIKSELKKNDSIRRIVKKIKIYREYLGDAKDFSDNYLEVAERQGSYEYRLMLLIHNLEKGMCRNNPRPFGKEKVDQIVKILLGDINRDSFEYHLACETLLAWKGYYEEMQWDISGITQESEKYLYRLDSSVTKAGRELFILPKQQIENKQFEDVLLTRRSVRDYLSIPLKSDDVAFAVKCFIDAPTACNRQMCKLYQISDSNIKEDLNKTVLGVGGFNTEAMTYFIITYDISAFEFYGERNQGYVNVGLVAMNFVNGLHSRGIGSCFLQWSNKRSDDLRIRKELGLSKSERIGLVVGAGYYKDKSYIPCSVRKPSEMVFKVI